MKTNLLAKETFADWVHETGQILMIESDKACKLQCCLFVVVFPDHCSWFNFCMYPGTFISVDSCISYLTLESEIRAEDPGKYIHALFEVFKQPFTLSRILGRNRFEVINPNCTAMTLIQEIKKLQESPMNPMQSASLLTCLKCGKPCQQQ